MDGGNFFFFVKACGVNFFGRKLQLYQVINKLQQTYGHRLLDICFVFRDLYCFVCLFFVLFCFLVFCLFFVFVFCLFVCFLFLFLFCFTLFYLGGVSI